MAIIVGMLNGTNQNKDADFQAMPSFLLSAGVRKNFSTELLVETNLVKAGQAFVKVKRESVSPNEEFIIPITLTADTVIATSGTGYVCLTVNSAKVNDGGSNAVDGTGIAQIEVLGTLPTKNFLLLATLASGVITDSRVFAKLSQEVLDFLGKGDVELGNVPNYEMASQEEAEVGTAEDKFMSPKRVLDSIAVNVSNSDFTLPLGENITVSGAPKACTVAFGVTKANTQNKVNNTTTSSNHYNCPHTAMHGVQITHSTDFFVKRVKANIRQSYTVAGWCTRAFLVDVTTGNILASSDNWVKNDYAGGFSAAQRVFSFNNFVGKFSANQNILVCFSTVDASGTPASGDSNNQISVSWMSQSASAYPVKKYDYTTKAITSVDTNTTLSPFQIEVEEVSSFGTRIFLGNSVSQQLESQLTAGTNPADYTVAQNSVRGVKFTHTGRDANISSASLWCHASSSGNGHLVLLELDASGNFDRIAGLSDETALGTTSSQTNFTFSSFGRPLLQNGKSYILGLHGYGSPSFSTRGHDKPTGSIYRMAVVSTIETIGTVPTITTGTVLRMSIATTLSTKEVSKNRFDGFLATSGVIGDTKKIVKSGIVSGFSGLSVNSDYSLGQDGEISASSLIGAKIGGALDEAKIGASFFFGAQDIAIGATDTILQYATASQYHTSTVYTKVKQFRANKSGTFRVSFSLNTNGNGYFSYAKVYVNGGAVSTEFSAYGTNPVIHSFDATVSAGDTIEIWSRGTGVGCTVSNSYIKGGYVPPQSTVSVEMN